MTELFSWILFKVVSLTLSSSGVGKLPAEYRGGATRENRISTPMWIKPGQPGVFFNTGGKAARDREIYEIYTDLFKALRLCNGAAYSDIRCTTERAVIRRESLFCRIFV